MPAASVSLNCVPFVNSAPELALAKRYFGGAAVVRISLAAEDSLLEKAVASGLPLWIDPSTDGFHHIARDKQSFAQYALTKEKRDVDWMERFSRISAAHKLGSVAFIGKPERKAVDAIVTELFGLCAKYKPKWVSIPQLPLVDDTSRNKINLALAKAASARAGHFELVLPAIFTHKNQTDGKTQWRKKVEQLIKCADESKAKRAWVVDATLDDSAGRPADKNKLAELVEMHKFIRCELDKLKSRVGLVVGPYWGFNLSLWARGLADFPAIPLGMSSRYTIPGLPINTGKIRLMLNCLKRKADSEAELLAWLQDAVKRVEDQGDAFSEFSGLIANWPAIYNDRDAVRRRSAALYSRWVTDLEILPPNARAVTLFQIFSRAYVVGSTLPDLPQSAQPARRPEQVAGQLMLTCLS